MPLNCQASDQEPCTPALLFTPLLPAPAQPRLQTYTAPQATGQYRFIMGGSVALNDGGWFEDDQIGNARVTPAFVSPSHAVLLCPGRL